MKRLLLSGALILIALNNMLMAQAPTCSSNVPFYTVDLRGNPTGTWISPGHSRNGNCCGTTSPDRCTSFEIFVDTGAAMISFEIASGAIPPGSMFYQINCGPQVAVGQPICISGPGPHHLTFCKPGNNQNTYRVTSIAKPTFPPDDTTRIGCSHPIPVLGMVESSVTWNSIFPGAPGDYNSYLNCTSNCDTSIYTPATNAPPMVEYLVCGVPIATSCGYVAVCDTVRIYNQQPLTGSVSPNPAGFCSGGPGVTLTSSAAGGLSPYTYTWRDQSLTQTCTGTSCLATAAGNYSIEIRDALYDSTYCPATFVSATVIVTPPPVVNAGPNQTLCPVNPVVVLNGSVLFASGGTWSGGNGTFNPSANSLLAGYTPTPAEIAAGQVTLTLTSTGAGGGCSDNSDEVTIFFPPVLAVTVADVAAGCYNGTATLNPTVTGGTPPYTYQWNTGQSSSSITASQGTYCLSVTDNLGCASSDCGTISTPPALALSVSSTACTTNGGSDGSATAVPSGGIPPYTYAWNTGGTTATINGLSYGAYTVTITDANGCIISAGVVVNEPRCNGFAISGSGTNITCSGSNDGTATAVVLSGTPTYTYLWNDPLNQTTATATNLAAGVYQCLVTDASGCIQTVNISLTQPAVLNNIMTYTNASAIGGNNGSASTNVSGGTPAYTYTWSTGANTAGISSLTAGTYSVVISDANNCTLTDSVRINQPPCSNLTAGIAAGNVSCFGGNNGSATAIVLFATGPVTYLWSNGATTSTVNGLAAGTYNVLVTDSLNCSTFVNFTITQPPALSIALSVTDIQCDYTNNGTIELTVSGGTFPYTYNWSNGLSTEDQIDLSNGSYNVTVTDNNGCTTSGTASIVRPAPILITSAVTPVMCNGQANGAVNVNVSGGIAPYTYSWSNGQTTQDISGLVSDEYLLTVTDANNCSTPAFSALVDQPDTLKVNTVTAACPVPGSGLSLATFTATGGNNGAYQFSVDNGATYFGSGLYSVLLPVDSNYIIVVKDTFGCISSTSLTLPVAPEPEILTVSYPSCIADGNTTVPVLLTVTGGNGGPLSASFDNGTTWLAAGVYTDTLTAGASYSILVRDSSGCISVTENISISTDIVLSGVPSLYNGGYNISCFGTSTGSVDLTASGGSGSYTYLWSSADTTADLNAVNAGTYSVVVTDNDGCSDTLAITLSEPAALTSSATSMNNFNGYDIRCAGENNGAVDLSVSGGVSTYSFAWSNGNTTEDLSGLTTGSYSVTVTDANGCTSGSTITLSAPAALNITSLQQNVLCNGLATGTIDQTVTGGVTPYSYLWSNASGTEDLSSLTAGTYSVVLTDLNGCTSSGTYTITQPSAVAVTNQVTDFNGFNISCNGGSDGVIDLTVNGGVAPYNYNWNNAAVTQDLSGITAGSYSVTVTDANGCSQVHLFTLTEPAVLSGNVVSAQTYNGYDVSCAGSTNGGIDLSIAGGVTAYSYSWSNGSTTQDITNLGAGSYSVTVTDANGCTYTTSLSLSEPNALSISNTAQSILCNGMSTGSLDISVSGGVTAYSYLWSNSSITEDQSALAAGTYSVTVTDLNGCTVAGAYTLTEPSAVAVTSTLSDFNGYEIACQGGNTGTIDVTTSGGVAPYTYNWSTSAVTEDLAALVAGTYSVIISDANGCTQTHSYVLTEPAMLNGTISSVNNFNGYQIDCAANATGAIDLSVSGGVLAYTYNWSNNSSTEDLSGLTAGNYSVTVTDANGCTYTNSMALNEPPALNVSSSVVDILCNGQSTGEIDLTVSGGVAAYTFNWSNSASTEDLSAVAAGTYSVTVTDLNGCLHTSSYTLSEPTALTSTGTVSDHNGYNISCYGGNDGTIDLSVTGGVPAYTYNWSDGSTNEDISNATAGTYSVIITDDNNCSSTFTVVLSQPAGLLATVASVNNYNGYDVQCFADSNGGVDLTVIGGVPVYSYAWAGGETTEDLSNTAAGLYSVIVTDMNGCIITASITLNEPSPIVNTAVVSNIPCNGFMTGAIDLTTTGGVTPFDYAWSNGQQSQDIDSLGAGSYVVISTDANGCTVSNQFSITELSPVDLSAALSAPQCSGDANAAINITVTGGTAPYAYTWTSGQTSEDLVNITSGVYTIVIHDSNNCSATDTFYIAEPSPLVANTTSPLTGAGYNVSGYGASDGSIDLTATGGTAPYTYAWSTGSTGQDLNGVPAGSYTVVVTDANGCQAGDSIVLTEPYALEMPTGISPNGDGYNDYFVVHGIELYSDNKIEIYNRWGNLVYDSYGYQNQWNGTNENGGILPDATYFVVLTINNGDIVLKGYVDVRR